MFNELVRLIPENITVTPGLIIPRTLIFERRGSFYSRQNVVAARDSDDNNVEWLGNVDCNSNEEANIKYRNLMGRVGGTHPGKSLEILEWQLNLIYAYPRSGQIFSTKMREGSRAASYWLLVPPK